MTTLLIRHLPPQLSIQDRVSFISYYGSIQVSCFSNSGKMKHCALAQFTNEASAKNAMFLLHQLKVLSSYLVVEYWRDRNTSLKFDTPDDNLKVIPSLDNWYEKLHHISPQLGVHFPMDPLIRYKYPDASTSIVRNIGKALMLIPSFYYQVLHLMNKLQLPPPFINSDYEFDELLLPRTFSVDKYQLKSETSESELEDDYADHLTGTTDRIQKAKTLLQSLKRKRLLKSDNETKYTKTNPKCLSVISTPQPIHIQFDPIGTTVKKAIRLPDKLTLPTNQSSNYFDNSILTKNFDRMEQQPPSNVTKIETHTNDEAANSDSVTDEELNNRVTKEEMCELAPFKNYTLGVPSCRLYVKNIAKKVTESQLRRLFARFTFDSNRQLVDGFHVQLLTSGRMRGQAFVTYSSVEIAQQALNATNGLWIENKPIVVNYARPIINQD